ncbi:MAG: hypothetical protein JW951_06520, partial [Lentisphaerae bacterium]|nr:hypothetical protein [Lentisphaerota bacterium]
MEPTRPSKRAAFFEGPFSYDLELRVVGPRIEMAWTEWDGEGRERRRSRAVEVDAGPQAGTPPAPGARGAWPALTVPGHTVRRPVVAVDGKGTAHLACCVERLVVLGEGDVNWHSRIVTAALDGGR